MSYIDEVPVTAAPTMPADVKAITNDGFFPDISMPAMRDAMRLDSTVTDARLRPALIDAILTANRLLRDWQAGHLASGVQKLEEVPALKVDGESQYVAHYRRAVYSFAKADIFESYRDYDTTASALTDKKNMEWMDMAPDVQRRNGHWAINDILGRTHATVELI
ncbi:head completion/stabilization protein [Herbaspirillum sp. DW155]|uniref:head completion/stabilization protein n=1 Tax=Herbaspirillum sp. DW155 TaxID=3095609 RepID=UPI00308965AD|nr:head completion/stabilization protein [Herbaspirillum sp. DW155]